MAILFPSSFLSSKPIGTQTRPRNTKHKPKPRGVAMASAVRTKVVPAVIVGGGRVGRALQEMGNGHDVLIKRGDSVPLDFNGPIFVCTRNDDLEAVLEATPKSRWNGMFRVPHLKFKGFFIIIILIYGFG